MRDLPKITRMPENPSRKEPSANHNASNLFARPDAAQIFMKVVAAIPIKAYYAAYIECSPAKSRKAN